MKGALHLGRIAGIKIEIHWTFSFLLIWVVFLDMQKGGDLNSSLLSILLILMLFICVVLHELGHALTAKRFGIGTKKITLLPIGGVALLEKMPEKPGQELLVAIAGPAVNVLIAMLLSFFIPFHNYFALDPAGLEDFLNTSGFQSFLLFLFIANIMLVVFNMIPAFPMDGGRVLRALLAYKLGRVKATEIASGLGQILAVLFFMLGILINPFLILIALFIFMGAYGENQMVKQQSVLEGHIVKEAMLTKLTILHPWNSMEEAVHAVLASTEKDFVVTDNNRIVGVLYHKDIIKNAGKPATLIKDVMQTNIRTVDISQAITTVLEYIRNEKSTFFPVTRNNELVGAIDMTNISEFIVFKSNP
ncbi:site-2 protease family protein [Sediminicola sp. 1XM1-17]|uniref:site-2 protease family protein n=1 Tax=Sediminicola sp. 1XM1-17 TaxID=3127702 RepID=UPI00307763D7